MSLFATGFGRLFGPQVEYGSRQRRPVRLRVYPKRGSSAVGLFRLSFSATAEPDANAQRRVALAAQLTQRSEPAHVRCHASKMLMAMCLPHNALSRFFLLPLLPAEPLYGGRRPTSLRA